MDNARDGGIPDWEAEAYRKIFDDETRGLERRMAAGAGTLEDIESQLRTLYICDGNDQIGRGAVGDITIAAQIAAYERFIFQRKADAARESGAP